MSRARRARRWLGPGLLILAALLALGLAAHGAILRSVATALIVSDPLVKADAIVVVAGGTPFREEAAVALFRQGWAPWIVLSRQRTPAQAQALHDLGIRPYDYPGEQRAVLLKLGVPPDAILTVAEFARITETEMRTIHTLARSHGFRRLIFVSSAQHTRRIKVVWSRETRGAIEAVMHPVYGHQFQPDRWWQSRRLAEALLHEYLGLAAVYLGVSPLIDY